MRFLAATLPLVAFMAAATPAAGQDKAQPAPRDTTGAKKAANDSIDAIIVTATRLPGEIETDAPPVAELDEQDIAAYGATSIDDLISQISAETNSGRGRGGRPIILINGQRIANFREFRRYPPEAIRKVQVLPEEVALKFGYPPDSRVVNIILKPDFASRNVEAEFGMPPRGGTSTATAEASLLKIAGPNRFNASAEYTSTSQLTEAERGVQQTTGNAPLAAGSPDPANYRTLVPAEDKIEGNLTWTKGLGRDGLGGQFTINGEVTRDVAHSLSGLDAVASTTPGGATTYLPLARRITTDTYSLGSSLNKLLGNWRFQTTLDANRTDIDSLIDRRSDTLAIPPVPPGGMDRALSRTYTISSKTTLIGHPFALPAGEASLTLDSGFDWNRIDSQDTRTSMGPTQLTRGDLSGGANLSIPIASAREGVLSGLGEFSINLTGGIDRLSDFGTLTNWNAGANWNPTNRLGFQASYIVRDAAPGLTQLGNPTIVNYNVPVYDFATGQTVLATVTGGGNPSLKAETQRDWKLSVNYDLDIAERSSFRIEYFSNHSTNTTASFPLLTPAIEAAFPGRVTRDGNGTLVAIDERPVTFADETSSRIRYGFNMFGRLGKAKGRPGAGARDRAAMSNPPPSSAARGAFDPSRFAQIRERFCATPAGQSPDLSQLPEPMQERLKGEDGKVDPARVARMRQRFCAADGANGRPRFDPERFARLRAALCPDPGKAPDLSVLPDRVIDRLKGADGKVDPARLKALQQRLCSMPAPAATPGQEHPGAAGSSNSGNNGRQRPMGLPGFGGRDRGQGRWRLSLYHTIELTNRVLVAPGGPQLDQLRGDAIGSAGVPRHKVELEGGMYKGGVGGRISLNWQSATTVRGSGAPSSSDLRFGSLTTIDARMFVDLSRQHWLTGGGDDAGIWKGARFSLRIKNLLDTHMRVTDSAGTVPLRYQPGLIDPVGRFVQIELRKMF